MESHRFGIEDVWEVIHQTWVEESTFKENYSEHHKILVCLFIDENQTLLQSLKGCPGQN